VTIAEVLTPFDVSEDDFARELAHDLHAAPDAAASGLSDENEAVLAKHGGIVGSTQRDVTAAGRAMLRAVTSNLAAQTRTSISVPQAADLLHVDGSRVRHRLRDRALYGFKIGSGVRLPLWQFEGGAPIPGLRAVLAALPADLHPLEIAGFMTSPDADLSVADAPSNPREWLIHGGDVDTVCERAADLDTW
jgi:hypothetical protein